MSQKILRPKLDPVFKGLFRNDEPLLKALLEALLDYPPGSIQEAKVLSPEISPKKAGEKGGFMDLKIKVDNAVVNVEIQLQTQDSYRERAMFYWSKAYSDDFRRGEDYIKLKQTISINIVDFEIFDCDEVCSTFVLLEKTRFEQLTDKCIFIFFELPKLTEEIDKNDRKKLWLQFLDAETEEELEMLNQTKVPEIQNAVGKLQEISARDIMREEVRLLEKRLSDEASIKGTAMREGLREGLKKGEKKGEKRGLKKGREEVINQLRKSGMTEEQIQSILKL